MWKSSSGPRLSSRQGDPVNVYPFIEAEKSQQRNVKRACVLLKVSRSAFYADRTAAPSQRKRDDTELTNAIVAVHDESTGTYGRSPRARRTGGAGSAPLTQARRPAHARRWPARTNPELVAHYHRARPVRRPPGGLDRAGLRHCHHRPQRPLTAQSSSLRPTCPADRARA